MSDTEIRAMHYTIEQLSEKLHATEQYLRDVKKALDIAVDALEDIAESNGDFITGSSTTLDAHEYAEMMLEQINKITKGRKDDVV